LLKWAENANDSETYGISSCLLAVRRACRQEIETHRKELASGQSEEKRLEAAAQEARERAAGLRAEVGASTQQSGLMVALMTARTKGEVSGLYGRLGE
jgi:structural maintenance of chromosome 4